LSSKQQALDNWHIWDYIRVNRKENMYTLKEIIEAWQRCYGEDLKKEYPGFVKDLIRNEKRPEEFNNEH
jgi:hypothetical protein